MNRAEQKIVHEALDLIWSFIYNMAAQDDIAKQGPTQESKMMEFMGDFPQLSNIKPEILIGKAEKMRMFDALPEQIAAMKAWRDVVMGYPMSWQLIASQVLLLYRGTRFRTNRKTRQRFTHADIAEEIGITKESYDVALEGLNWALLLHYKKLKAQNVGKNKKNTAIYGIEY